MSMVKLLLSLSFCALLANPAFGQQSGRPIRLVVPYPAGGTADLMARSLATPLAVQLGQPVVVENRAGAAGTVGAAFVSRAEPDGYTLFFTNTGPSAIAPAMNKNISYDPVKDFAAVALVAQSPMLLVTHAAFEAKDVRSLIELAKANPGKIEYSTAGVGSNTHLTTELFAQAAGIRLLHVPYQGQAPSVTAVVSGDVKMLLTTPSASMFEMVRAGRLKLIGVSTREPTSLAPGAPPIANGLPGFEAQHWFGVLAPAKTSDAILNRLHDAIGKVMADPAVIKQFEGFGCSVGKGSREQFGQLISDEAMRWRTVVQRANLVGAD